VVVAVTATSPIPAVIPLFTSAASPAPLSTVPGLGSTDARRGLPLPGVQSPRPSDAPVYGMAALDCHGRIADRTVLHALGWPAGHRLTIRETADTLTLVADPDGHAQVTRQGHLRIPAALRHRYALWGSRSRPGPVTSGDLQPGMTAEVSLRCST
jgi:hypothetical protein